MAPVAASAQPQDLALGLGLVPALLPMANPRASRSAQGGRQHRPSATPTSGPFLPPPAAASPAVSRRPEAAAKPKQHRQPPGRPAQAPAPPPKPATTVPDSTTESPTPLQAKPLLALVGALALTTLTSCSNAGLLSRRPAATNLGLLAAEQRRDPALSGDGRLLASIIQRGGKSTVVLQEQPGGRQLALKHLRSHQPHRSPALSWNGRYLAVLIQQGQHPIAVIEDRLRGTLLRLPPLGDAMPEALSLAPDGRRLALQVVQGGQQRVQVFDLTGLLEADPPAGRP